MTFVMSRFSIICENQVKIVVINISCSSGLDSAIETADADLIPNAKCIPIDPTPPHRSNAYTQSKIRNSKFKPKTPKV